MLPVMVTVTLIGLIVIEPSFTSKVTVPKLPFMLVNWSAARPILVVPTSVLVALASPLKVKSLLTLYKVFAQVAV